MATEVGPYRQALAETRTHVIDYTADLLSGVTVTSASATHTPPSGSAGTVTVSASSPNVYATLGPLTVTGIHIVDVLAGLSDGETSAVRVLLKVDY